jgi:photosystem II stability/assembly factor-like uncharacterized protein
MKFYFKRLASVGLLCMMIAINSHAQVEAYFSRFYPQQPSVRYGGMTVCLAVNPSNDNEIIAATHTGGLMKTTNRGERWYTLFNLPPHIVTNVQYAPMDTRNVIAATIDSYTSPDRGGLWLSRDGGGTWTRPAITLTYALPASTRIEAYSIATFPGSRRIIAGTSIGVAISDDNGETWTYNTSLGQPVYAVALMRFDNMVAATASGIFFWNGVTRAWNRERTGIGMAFGYNSFHVPKQFMADVTTANPVFVITNTGRIQFSNNGGQNWNFVDTLPAAINNNAKGTLFVRIAKPGFHIGPDGVDLYVTNKYGVYRKFCPRTGSNFSFRFNEGWQGMLGQQHSDMSDLCLDREGNPFLLGGDGGVQKFWRNVFGDNFSYDGGGTSQNGFHGLQVTEVTGAYVESRSQYDMYFATQDNNIFGSEDAGASWPNQTCCEGFFLEHPRRIANESDADLGYVACSGCSNNIANRLLRDARAINPPTSASSALKYVNTNAYVSFSFYKDTTRATRSHGTEIGTEYYLTQNYSAPDRSPSWTRITDQPNLIPRGMPHRMGSGSMSVLYQAYKAASDGGDDAGGSDGSTIQRVKLMRMQLTSEAYTGGAFYWSCSPRYPAMRNFGSIGVFPTEFSWTEVFAVDPNNPQHLIAADALNNRMSQSFNGGDDWELMPALTSLVTESGHKRFRIGRLTQVSYIGFNPDNPQLVLVGTRDAGIFYSWNNGSNWSKIPDSERIPEVSDFYFQTSGNVWASSYGRGLWKIEFAYRAPRPVLHLLCDVSACYTLLHPELFDRLRQNSNSTTFTHAIMITGGSIGAMRVDNNRLQDLGFTPGSTVINYTDDKQSSFNYKVHAIDSFTKRELYGVPKLDDLVKQGYVIKGIILNGDEVVDIVYGKEPTPFPIDTAKKQFIEVGEKELQVQGKPFFHISSSNMQNGYANMMEGEALTLTGVNFDTDPSNTPLVYIDGMPANFKIQQIKNDGSFEMRIVPDVTLGYHSIAVQQRTKDQKMINQVDEFMVLHEDKESYSQLPSADKNVDPIDEKQPAKDLKDIKTDIKQGVIDKVKQIIDPKKKN